MTMPGSMGNPCDKPAFPARKRRVLSGPLVHSRAIAEGMFPRLYEPAMDHVDLVEWAASHRETIESALVEHGALLFRGFAMGSLDAFRRFVSAASDGPLEYVNRASPRSEVGERVYTSTDYPAVESIFPHNEHSFSPVFPRKLFFYCETPAAIGGETPLGSGRVIRDAISPATRRRFLERGVMYIRNYDDHLGLRWQTVFQTEDRTAVEAYCRANGIAWRWKPGGLFTRQVAPAFVRHPVSGEMLWFNHATFFHVTTLGAQIRETLLSSYTEMELPNNTYYGDNSPLEPEVLEELRSAYARHMVQFTWQAGDVLMIDNLLVMHARNPYQGARRILVAMAEPVAARDVAVPMSARPLPSQA